MNIEPKIPNLMKAFILFLSLGFGLILPAYSQDNTSSGDKEALIALSKKQKKTGYILLGGGVGAAVIGGALFASNFCIWGCTNESEALAGTGGILFILGTGAAIASVPVLINAGKTSKRAMELSANSIPIYLPTRSHNGPRSHPALQLSIPLHR